MRTLVIETAAGACSVALIERQTIIAERHEDVGRGHAERLIPMIAELPDKGRADDILVDCGPGSFTGVRVGVAAARGLGLGWKVPVRGYSSLSLLAVNADWGSNETLAVAILAGHGQIFVQRFRRDAMRPLSDLVSLVPEEAALAIGDRLVIGSGAAALVAARGQGDAREAGLSARAAAALPASLSQLPPRPLYGRAPDAKPMM